MDNRLGIACISSFFIGIATAIIIIAMFVRIEVEEIKEALMEHSCIYYDSNRDVYMWMDEYMVIKKKDS